VGLSLQRFQAPLKRRTAGAGGAPADSRCGGAAVVRTESVKAREFFRARSLLSRKACKILGGRSVAAVGIPGSLSGWPWPRWLRPRRPWRTTLRRGLRGAGHFPLWRRTASVSLLCQRGGLGLFIAEVALRGCQLGLAGFAIKGEVVGECRDLVGWRWLGRWFADGRFGYK
jgi:hypothetical protein